MKKKMVAVLATLGLLGVLAGCSGPGPAINDSDDLAGSTPSAPGSGPAPSPSRGLPQLGSVCANPLGMEADQPCWNLQAGEGPIAFSVKAYGRHQDYKDPDQDILDVKIKNSYDGLTSEFSISLDTMKPLTLRAGDTLFLLGDDAWDDNLQVVAVQGGGTLPPPTELSADATCTADHNDQDCWRVENDGLPTAFSVQASVSEGATLQYLIRNSVDGLKAAGSLAGGEQRALAMRPDDTLSIVNPGTYVGTLKIVTLQPPGVGGN